MIAFDTNRLAYLEFKTKDGQIVGQPILRTCGLTKIIEELSFRKDGNTLFEVIVSIYDEGSCRSYHFAPLGMKMLEKDKMLITMMQIRG